MVLRPSCFVPATAPLGVQGGDAAPLASATFHLAAGGEFPVVEPVLVRPSTGDVLDVYATGGGGYGDPRLRPAEAVLEDVRNGLLTRDKADQGYGVVIDPETGELDAEATARRRAEGAG
jgi:N-methylhydantoinase B